MMDCEQARRLLADYLEENLPPRRRRQTAEHLAQCPGCAAERAALERVDRLLDAVEESTPPAGLWGRVESGLGTPCRRPVPRLAWVGAGVAIALLVAVTLWPRPAEPSTPFLRDHYRVAGMAAFGNAAVADVIVAIAEEDR